MEDQDSDTENEIRNFNCFQISSRVSNDIDDNSDDLIECFIGSVPLGSKVNIINDRDWEYLSKNKAMVWDVTTEPTDILKPYASGSPLEIKMRFVTMINLPNKQEFVTTFYVVNGGDISIVGKETAKQLGILKLGLGVNKVEKIIPFPKIKNVVVKLTIDLYVKPVQQHVRPVSVTAEKQVEAKLNDALQRDIIERVNQPSSCISPIVISYKSNDEIRIGIDMRKPNEAIKRENFSIPTFDSFMTKLKTAKYFSRLDLVDAYHQLELDVDSRHITTFITHLGLFRYKRLMFGVNSAVEIFQKFLKGMS